MNRYYETLVDSVNEGVIAIDFTGRIISYNRKAKEIFGIIYNQGTGHEAGRIKNGDIVIIADTRLGEDDGGLDCKDFEIIGVSKLEIPKESTVLAIGIIGGKSEQARIVFKAEKDVKNIISIRHSINGHDIYAEVDFNTRISRIVFDGQEFTLEFIKCIGHMVSVCSRTNKVKFYQEKGYTIRREDIKSLLYGKQFLAKGNGDGFIEVTGKNIFEVHPKETNINIVEFLETAQGRDVSYINEIKEINGRPTRCSLIQVKTGEKVIGAVLKVEDITELKTAMDERDSAIKTLNEVKNRLEANVEEERLRKITGQSPSIMAVKRLLIKASESDSTALLLGESGTGKGLMAECIHNIGKRSNKPFIYLNCASIPETLLESELFGYEGGSFTGAKKEGKLGMFEIADKGTIFLDEIGDIPPFIQVKLLDVLQNKRIRRIGSTRDLDIDVRIIAATNKDLERAVEEGSFRKDLYYRINVFPIYIPPLRMRREDIHPLIYDILPRVCKRIGCGEKKISAEAIKYMISYDWPGNIRELENVLERAVNISDGDIIFPEHLNISRGEVLTGTLPEPLSKILEEAEKKAIKQSLTIAEGNKSEAMKILGIGKTSLYEKIKKYNIK